MQTISIQVFRKEAILVVVKVAVFGVTVTIISGNDISSHVHSSVVKGVGGGRDYSPPIGMSTKMQNEKNTTFLALLRLLNALEWTK